MAKGGVVYADDVLPVTPAMSRKSVLAIVVPVQVVLASRTDHQVHGNKNLWRVFVVLNPGNSVLYWLFGRR